MHPDYEFNPGIGNAPYKQPYINQAIQAALDDDCDTGEDTLYTLTVNSGSGGGEHEEGATISITADDAPAGKLFDKWIGDIGYISSPLSKTTTVTMPASDITLTATYKDKEVDPIDKKDNYMVYSSWEEGVDSEGSSVAVDSSQKADTLLKVTFDLKPADAANEVWTWAQVSGYANGKFDEVTAVELVYAADNPVKVMLAQKGLSETGESYFYQLPASELCKVTVDIDDFKQPSWIAEDAATVLDLKEVLSLSFAATKEGAKTELELQGIYLDGYIDKGENVISSISGLHGESVSATLIGHQMELSVPVPGVYSVALYTLDGKEIYASRGYIEGQGLFSIGENGLSTGVYLLKVDSESVSCIAKLGLK